MTELDKDWKHARARMPFLRRWKNMTHSKADHAFWKIVRHYAEIVPLADAIQCAHREMRILYGMSFDKERLEWS